MVTNLDEPGQRRAGECCTILYTPTYLGTFRNGCLPTMADHHPTTNLAEHMVGIGGIGAEDIKSGIPPRY